MSAARLTSIPAAPNIAGVSTPTSTAIGLHVKEATGSGLSPAGYLAAFGHVIELKRRGTATN